MVNLVYFTKMNCKKVNLMKYTKILDLWLQEKKQYVRNSTYCNYSCLKTHVIEYFKNVNIEDITKKDIEKFMKNMLSKMLPISCLNIQKILKQSFEYATENGYIKENPYKKIKLPREEKKEVEVFSIEEMHKILATDVEKKYTSIVEIAYRTGMRIGEIMVLKWEDIDIDNNFLSVKRTFSKYYNSMPVIEKPKTKKSMRRIDLDKKCMSILKNIPHNSEYVFCGKTGNFLSYTIITKNFKLMCEKADVPYRCFHTLRHTHASILLANGVHPKVVQERLGHAKIGITLDTYSHLIPTIQETAIKVLDRL